MPAAHAVQAAGCAVQAVVMAAALDQSIAAAERSAQAVLLRDITPNPFQPVIFERSWLHWNDGCMPKLAQAIYDERRFADLAILADALEEAGCTNHDLLDHCRSVQEHLRGCWALDCVLARV